MMTLMTPLADHADHDPLETRLRDLVRDLTAVPGLAGHEALIVREMAARLRPHADEVTIDALGNVIARRGPADAPPRPKIAFLAHLDTVGLMVKRVLADGSVGVIPVGGANLKALPGAHVRVGEWGGVVGVRSQHQAQAGDAAVNSADDLYIHLGAGAAPTVTTPITYAPNVAALGGGLLASPHLDNRAGCAALVEVARGWPADAPWTAYFIGTVQEETTGAGAMQALAAIRPDAAIFIDGTVSYDTPDTRSRGETALGRGPVLTSFLYVSGLNGWHAHPMLRAHLKRVATAETIPVQQDAVHGLMSDARVATWLGLPSAVIGLPMRGKHSPTEIVHLADLANAIRLILALPRHPWPTLTWE
jgi:putative aminopeptidase FrvX